MPLRLSLIVVIFFAGESLRAFAAGPTSQPTTQGTLRSFKGWELYAWREGETWQFSVLVGTNRNKSDGEITDKKQRLADIAAVKSKLAGLAEGEWVTLGPRTRDGELPPDKVQGELKAYCDEHHLHYQ